MKIPETVEEMKKEGIENLKETVQMLLDVANPEDVEKMKKMANDDFSHLIGKIE